MITGAHVMIFTRDEAADRAFLRDVLEVPCIDSGGGWLIFKLPPAELGVHSGDERLPPDLLHLRRRRRIRREHAGERRRGPADHAGGLGPKHRRQASGRRHARHLPGPARPALRVSASAAPCPTWPAMHFLDQAKIFIRSGAGGPGAVSFRREKYHRIWRPRRRRRRQGRRHRLRGGRGPQHADRLPLHPAFPGAARQGRLRPEPHRRRRRRPRHQGPGRHPDPRRRRGARPRRPHRGRPARRPAEGRRRRPRQRQLQDLDQPRPAPARHRLAGRGDVGLAAAQAARRRRASSACPMPASRPSSTPSPTPRPRSATIRSPPCARSLASSATRAASSSSPTFPA